MEIHAVSSGILVLEVRKPNILFTFLVLLGTYFLTGPGD